MSEEFVHLHNHSEYSLLDGMLRITDLDGKPSEFLKKAAQNFKAIAITDHGNMYGAIDFYNNAHKVGIKPIIGCELYITTGPRTDKNKDSKYEYGHITALVENETGYKNLIEMLSLANIEGFYRHPRIDFELLEKYKEGIIFLSGCLKSLVAYPCSKNEMDKAVNMAAKFKDILGPENFYLEIMDHGIEEERIALKNLIEVSKKTGLGLVATNDCHYEKKEDWFAHDVHICIATNSTLDDPNRLKMNTQELYFKSAQEMVSLFRDFPEAIKNTVEIASKCNLKIEKGKIYLPEFSVPDEYMKKAENNKFEAQYLYLKDLCYKNLSLRFNPLDEKYIKRLEFELGVIHKMGFASYFLIVMDFIKYARDNGIPVGPGRGSGAGSLVAYALDITRIDPLKHDLLFERFLNPERKSMPDLDIDFSDSGRELVIDYVRRKYGSDNVAHIITYGSIMAKTAIKDVGRVLNFPAAEMNSITKFIPTGVTLNQALNEIEEIKNAYKKGGKYKQLFDVALKIEGLRRHTGIHAAGVLITAKPVMKYVPMAVRDNIKTTQYDGNILTELGLLKVDFLGLRTLTVIEETVKLIRERHDKNFNINNIPLDDENTFNLLRHGKTVGVFQLESDGMQKLVRNLKPTVFADISALVALYRPGPLQSGMVESFVKRKHGKEKIVYDHPLLEEILRDTYGNIVYQEQVMEIAKKLAGFTPAEADGLRKAMGKKIFEEMEKAREHFMSGCEKNSVVKKIANKIFDQMVEFAKYGFNKSHSVAYATISYQTAYLKANYPLEFMASLLTSEIGHNAIGNDSAENKIVKYIEEADSLGINILPPDINKSYPKFSIEDNKTIRFAFTAIKNIGDSVAEDIVKERKINGPYKSLTDFISRNNSKQFNKRVLESLSKAGAFDSLYQMETIELKRAQALSDISAGIDKILSSISQDMLFGSMVKEKLKITEHERLKNEKEVLGFYMSGHPLVSSKRFIKMISRYSIEDIINGNIKEGSLIRLTGMINQIKPIKSKRNEQMCKFVLEDLYGEIEIFVPPKIYKKYSALILNDTIVSVSAVLKESSFTELKYELVLEDIADIYSALNKWGKSLVIFFNGKMLMSEEEKDIKPLLKFFDLNKGKCGVCFSIDSINGSRYVIETDFRTEISRNLVENLDRILGSKLWQIESE